MLCPAYRRGPFTGATARGTATFASALQTAAVRLTHALRKRGGGGSSGAGLVNTMQEDGPLGFPLADEGGDEQQGVCWEWSGALRVDTPGSFPMRIPSDGHMHGGADICLSLIHI